MNHTKLIWIDLKYSDEINLKKKNNNKRMEDNLNTYTFSLDL